MAKALLSLLRSEKIPLRLRKKIGKFYPLKKGTPFDIDFLGAKYHGTVGNLVDNKMFLYGRDEAPTLRLIQSLLKKHKMNNPDGITTFVDIGVNSGVHFVCGAVVADKTYGFEPWDKVRNRAQFNLDLNKPHHGQIFPFGLSDKDDKLPFLCPAEQNLGTGAFVRGDKKHKNLFNMKRVFHSKKPSLSTSATATKSCAMKTFNQMSLKLILKVLKNMCWRD